MKMSKMESTEGYNYPKLLKITKKLNCYENRIIKNSFNMHRNIGLISSSASAKSIFIKIKLSGNFS